MPDDSKDVKVGTLIALMVGEGEDWKDVAIPGSAAAAPSQAAPAAPKTAAPAAASSGTHGHSDMYVSEDIKFFLAFAIIISYINTYCDLCRKMGPAVRTLLEAYQMSPSEVSGSGPHGLLTKGDVLQVIKQKGLSAKPPKPGELMLCIIILFYAPYVLRHGHYLVRVFNFLSISV